MGQGTTSSRIDALLQKFADAVIRQGEELRDAGDPRAGNGAGHRYAAAARELLASGDTAIDRFASLLWHPDDQVKVMAAAYLLNDRTEVAVDTLRPIAAGSGLAALGAQMALERYEEGNLSIED